MVLQLITKSSESKLVQMVADIKSQPVGWQAIHFRLSQLLEEYKSEYLVKIAINLIHDLLKTHDGAMFLLVDSSIIVLCQKVEQTLLDKLIFQMRYLYMDDPLCYDEMGQENPNFCHVYDLKRDWYNFDLLCADCMALATRKQPMAIRPMHDIRPEPDRMQEEESNHIPHKPVLTRAETLERSQRAAPARQEIPIRESSELSAVRLAAIEHNLQTLDMHTVTRRQPVCAVLPGMKVRRVFDELYIHIAHLRRLMKSDVDFFSNRWLFKYLTHTLDQRMIDLIHNDPGSYLASPISVNFNVETILSSWFARFDANIKPATKVSIVLELPVVDLFADMVAFKTAMREAQRLGYRVCLDGLSTESFLSIDREKLGLDLIKVQWNSDVLTDLKTSNNEMAKAIETTGNNRIILCRCDNGSALEYGMALGISLFQGRYLDKVLNPTAKVEN